MRSFAVLAVAFLLAGCGATSERPASPAPEIRTTDGGRFTLYVSNQSFDRPSATIVVTIDGKVAVSDEFDVENQHNWVEFRFDLPTGRHTLRATAPDEGVVLEREFTVKPKRQWAVLNFWCCGEAYEPRFTFDLYDHPIAFA